MNEAIHIAHGPWEATILPLGAELKRLRWKGQDLLWSGDPAWWARTAPVLFPVVGAVEGGVIRVHDRSHPMPKHGFARDRAWSVVAETECSATFRLVDDDATRHHYPFAFRLDLRFHLGEEGLRMEAELHNPGERALPASFGFHPAFRWPLWEGHDRSAHCIAFDQPEPSDLRRLEGDVLGATRWPTPVVGSTLALTDSLFDHDALIWDAPHSRALRFGVPGERALVLRWDLPHLGIWTKPGAPFLCLEPWQGFADPVGFSGAFEHKPGIAEISPQGHRTWSALISIAEPSE